MNIFDRQIILPNRLCRLTDIMSTRLLEAKDPKALASRN